MRGTDASLSQRSLWISRAEGPVLLALVRGVALAMLALLALLGFLLVARRASGALTEPLPPLALLAAGGLLAVGAILFRRLVVFPVAVSRPGRPLALKLSAVVTLVLLLWAFGLSAAGAGGGMLAFWGLLLVEEGMSWELLRHQARSAFVDAPMAPSADALSPLPTADAPSTLPDNAWSMPAYGEAEADVEFEEAAAETQRDDELVQQYTRRRLDDGREVLEGWLCAELAPGQRHATAHVAICPPLSGEPACYAEQSDGPDAQVKVAQVLAHGVRLEIKLNREQAEPSRVGIEFSIQQNASDERP